MTNGLQKTVCYDRRMNQPPRSQRSQRKIWLCVLCGLCGCLPSAYAADDPLARARLLYNQHQYEAAVNAAEQARLTPARADAADLIAARAYLERFRASSTPGDLVNARERLRRIDPQRFPARERAEFIV